MIGNHKYFHWLYFDYGKNHYFNLGSGLFIWLFLAITQPFGIYENNMPSYWLLVLFLLPFGSVFTLISYLADIVSIKLLSIDIRQNYRLDVRIWVVKILLFIHSLYLIRWLLCDGSCLDLSEYLQLWLACLLLFTFTYFPFMLYAKYLYFHKMIGQVEDGIERIELLGEGKEKLVLEKERIVYFKSDDNYVEVYVETDDVSMEKILFRSTLKNIQNQLIDEHQFVRIHRSFLVNIRYASSSGSKETLVVICGATQKPLPISKKYQNDVSELFINPK